MPKKKNRNYFTQETEDAILDYNHEPNSAIRSKIYKEKIHYPFFKLTQNIIHTFKFYYTEVENIEHLQHEIITFLLSKIHLYTHVKKVNNIISKIMEKYDIDYDYGFIEYINGDKYKIEKEDIHNFVDDTYNHLDKEIVKELKAARPPKAYSYFGTIVKRWLILYNTKNYEKKKKRKKIPNLSESDENKLSYNIGDENIKSNLDKFMDLYLEYCTSNIYKLFPKDEDAKVADAILEIFRKRENLEEFNKKALYIYIREMVNVKTPKITQISNQLKKIFNEHYQYYLKYGYVNFS